MMFQIKTVRIVSVPVLVTFLLALPAHAQQVVHVNETVAVPFGPYADVVKEASTEALKKVLRVDECADVGTSKDKRAKAKQYRCGEYPVGNIVDDNWKMLDRMDLGKDFSQDKGKNQYSFKNSKGGSINLDLFLSRRQSSDSVTVNSLREFGKDSLELSRHFGRDQYVKVNPVDGALEQEACVFGPGVKARATDILLEGKIKRKDAFCFIWCADAKAEGTIDIDFGDIEIASLKACVDLKTELKNNKPVISITDNGEIEFKGISHKGLKVKANMKATDWISKVLEFFGVEVSEMISKAVAKAVKKETGDLVDVNLKKIKSGEYLKDYLDKSKLKPLLKELNKEIKTKFQEAKAEERISRIVRDLMCVTPISELDLPLAERRELLKACRVSTELKLVDFQNDKESRKLGCYKNAFPVYRTSQDSDKEREWRTVCAFGVQYDLKIELKMSKLSQCLFEAWNLQKMPQGHCQEEIVDVVQQYVQGDLDDLLSRTNKKVVSDLSDADVQMIRNLSENYLGIQAPSASSLKALLNN